MNDVKIVDIHKVIPYEKNPRKNDEAVKYVANSIKEFGFKVPIVVDKNLVVITGHTRLKAALSLGFTEVPIIVADDLTDEQVKAYRIADNKSAEKSYWDEFLLKDEIDELGGLFDFQDFGFEDWELEQEDVETPEKTDNDPFKERKDVDIEIQYNILIECENEKQMEQRFNKLKELGIPCRTL